MYKIMEEKPIKHAMIWIGLYVVAVNIGDILSEIVGRHNSVTSFLVIAFCAVLVLYLKKTGWFETDVMEKINSTEMKNALYFIPLVLLAFIQFIAGVDTSLEIIDVLLVVILMIGVGTIEELIFRGFLFQAICSGSKINRAIIISGATFGVGHIVNLLRGYSLAEQSWQIFIGIAVGIFLAELIVITKNILPGIIFHIILNTSGSVTLQDGPMGTYLAAATLVISVFYAIYLKKFLPVEQEVRQRG